MTTSTETPRLHVSSKNKTLPVIFSYRQLLRRYQEESMSKSTPDLPSIHDMDTDEDDAIAGILERARNYEAIDDDADEDLNSDLDDDDENDDDDPQRRGTDEYDYEDPFIDDSEMLVDDPEDDVLPEYDGFFVYHGPLDGNDGAGFKAALAANKRNPKPKTTTATATTTKKPIKTAKDKEPVVKKDKARKPPSKASDKAAEASDQAAAGGSEECGDEAVEQADDATDEARGKQSSQTRVSLSPTPSVPPAQSEAGVDSEANPSEQASTPGDQSESHVVDLTREADANKASPAPKSSSVESLLPLDPEIAVLVEKLRHDARSETFENKAKFPPQLRPGTLDIAALMFKKYNAVDDNIVAHLRTILPYNRFTLKKFMTTKAAPARVKELKDEVEILIDALQMNVSQMIPELQRQYDDKVAAIGLMKQNKDQADDDMDEDMPTMRFRYTDDIKRQIYEIVKKELDAMALSNEIYRYNDMQENMTTDGKVRKNMYSKLLERCWPEGWTTTVEISRGYSQYKAKMDKQKYHFSDARRRTDVPVEEEDSLKRAKYGNA